MRRAAALLALAAALAACDRVSLNDPEAEEASAPLGTFVVTAREVGGEETRQLSGRARFDRTDISDPTVVIRLSDLGGVDSARVELVIPEPVGTGDRTVGDGDPALVAACYRSARVGDGPYASASGTLTLTEVGEASVKGSLVAVVAATPEADPGTSRGSFEIEGSFRARFADLGLRAGDVRRCRPTG